jgi:hypothetical protein
MDTLVQLAQNGGAGLSVLPVQGSEEMLARTLKENSRRSHHASHAVPLIPNIESGLLNASAIS